MFESFLRNTILHDLSYYNILESFSYRFLQSRHANSTSVKGFFIRDCIHYIIAVHQGFAEVSDSLSLKPCITYFCNIRGNLLSCLQILAFVVAFGSSTYYQWIHSNQSQINFPSINLLCMPTTFKLSILIMNSLYPLLNKHQTNSDINNIFIFSQNWFLIRSNAYIWIFVYYTIFLAVNTQPVFNRMQSVTWVSSSLRLLITCMSFHQSFRFIFIVELY